MVASAPFHFKSLIGGKSKYILSSSNYSIRYAQAHLLDRAYNIGGVGGDRLKDNSIRMQLKLRYYRSYSLLYVYMREDWFIISIPLLTIRRCPSFTASIPTTFSYIKA
jgi:hypothetical protein